MIGWRKINQITFNAEVLKLKDIGERRIIDRLMSMHSKQVPKDDCALIEDGEDYLLLSTDVITPLTHAPKGASPEQIGSFFANINLSDIAGMAGEPIGFMSAYSASPDTDIEFFEGLETGVSKVLDQYEVEHLGGDMKEGASLTLTGIAVGRQKKEYTRKRGDIKPGQLLGVTNRLGRSASGYVFYKTGYKKDLGINLMMGVQARIRDADIISRHGGKFMMDLSDGIFSSVAQMKNDYGIGFKIVEDSVQQDRNVDKASELSGASVRDLLFSFGGDYEILFTIENENYGDFLENMESNNVDVSIIGQVWEENNIIFDGERWEAITGLGYEHFTEKPTLGRIK